MDKKKLNNEIVLCRPLVRKAKVIVIRKILKKMKVLKSCKKESVKDKKLKKAKRLFKKVQILKKLKVDDVTKFALRNKDLNSSKEKPVKNLKTLAFLSLAKFSLLDQKIQSIKEQVPNWETELPLLLDSIGKKKKNKKTEVKNVKSANFLKSSDEKSNKNKDEQDIINVKKGKKNKNNVKSDLKLNDNNKSIVKNEPKLLNKGRLSENDCDDSSDQSSNKSLEENEVKELIKIEDPFFVGKKMIASKLLLEEESRQPTKKFDSPSVFRSSDSFNFDSKPPFQKKFNSFKGLRDEKSFDFNGRPFKKKFNIDNNKFDKSNKKESAAEISLHPSWEAKRNQKAQLIQPFQGKKIKFSD